MANRLDFVWMMEEVLNISIAGGSCPTVSFKNSCQIRWGVGVGGN